MKLHSIWTTSRLYRPPKVTFHWPGWTTHFQKLNDIPASNSVTIHHEANLQIKFVVNFTGWRNVDRDVQTGRDVHARPGQSVSCSHVIHGGKIQRHHEKWQHGKCTWLNQATCKVHLYTSSRLQRAPSYIEQLSFHQNHWLQGYKVWLHWAPICNEQFLLHLFTRGKRGLM